MIVNGIRVSKEAFVGDPFLGAIAGGALRMGSAALARRALQTRPPIGFPTAGARVLPGAGTIIQRAPLGLGTRVGAGMVVRGLRAGAQLVAGPGGRRLPSGFADTRAMPGMGMGMRRRRMNPLNPKALRRALSRAGAFEKFCRRTLVITRRVKLKRRRAKR